MAAVSWLTQSDQNTIREMLEVDLMEDLFLNNNLLSFFTKKPAEGDPWKIPVRTAGTTQHGADDVGGIAGVDGARPYFDAFTVNHVPTYGFAQIPQTAIAASMMKEGAAVPMVVDAVREARQRVATDIERAFAGNGYAVAGTIGSHSGSSGAYVLTLTNLSDTISMNVGDVLVSAAAYNSASLDSGTAKISYVDRDAGTITVADSGSWAPTDGHVLFLALDKLSGSYDSPSKPFGLDFWLPIDPTQRTATVNGVNRAKDPQNLAGALVAASATDILSGINRCLAKLAPKKDANPKVAFMSDLTYAALQAQLFNKVRFEATKVEGSVNFEGIKFRTAKGELQAATSHAIPDNRIYILSRDSFTVSNMLKGDFVQSATNNGQDFIDAITRTGAQVRQWAYLQLGCKAPGLSGIVTLS